MSDPFVEHHQVAVRGGALHVWRAGAPPDEADAVVLAVHGITASHAAWRAVARELCADGTVCLLAPDLRGRGRSATLPGPYCMSRHVADLVAVLDDAGVSQAMLAGHSMGAHIAARLAEDHPDRVTSVVLLDGGLTRPAKLDDRDEELEDAAAPAIDRLDCAASSVEQYVERWRAHPAFARAWNDDVEAYVRAEVVEDERGVRCVVSEEAIAADSFALLCDGSTRTAVARVPAPVRLLVAERGIFDDDQPLLTPGALAWLAFVRPDTRVERVADVNHYTLLIGDGPGPARVAAAIAEAVPAFEPARR